ncbi:hypothetical protein KY345_01530 [Candidatus Woesearchaeota archaeon]|nr:hypothetical protein [Candidatus Woesearchaeota archaeon]
MSHFEIDLFLDGGVMERLYIKPERGERLIINEIFPKGLDIKKWFIREAN